MAATFERLFVSRAGLNASSERTHLNPLSDPESLPCIVQMRKLRHRQVQKRPGPHSKRGFEARPSDSKARIPDLTRVLGSVVFRVFCWPVCYF